MSPPTRGCAPQALHVVLAFLALPLYGLGVLANEVANLVPVRNRV